MGAASSHHSPAAQDRGADIEACSILLARYRAIRESECNVSCGTAANSSGEVVGIPVENREAAGQDDSGDGSFDYIWRVEGLSSCWDDESFRAQFKAKGREWELSLLPESSCDQRSVSVRLHLRDVPCGHTDVKVRLTYIICLFNRTSGGQDWPRSEINAFPGRDGNWGFKDFIATDTFVDPSNGFVVDGSCELGIKLLRVSLFRVKRESLMVQHRHVNHDHTWVVRSFSTIEHQGFRREEFDAAGCHWSIYLHRISFERYISDEVMLFLSLDSTSQKKSVTVSYQFHVKGLVGGFEFCDAHTNVFVPGQGHGHCLKIPSNIYQTSGWSFEEDTCIVRVRMSLLGYAEDKSSYAMDLITR